MQDRDWQSYKLQGEWSENPRWRGVRRTYTSADVVRLRGSVQEEHTLARRGAERLWRQLHEAPYINALGAMTGMQALQQALRGSTEEGQFH